MKITIEPYSGGTYSAQEDAEQIEVVINMFKGLLVQMGYHPKTVDEHLITEEPWFDTTKYNNDD